MKIKFSKNKIPYGQDMGMHRDIPIDVVFQTNFADDVSSSHDGRLTLTGDGYGFGVKGQPLGNYGNGFITVSKNDLLMNRDCWEIVEKEQRKIKLRFELEFDENHLGKGWMNIDNLELCLFSKEHTKRELLKVRKID